VGADNPSGFSFSATLNDQGNGTTTGHYEGTNTIIGGLVRPGYPGTDANDFHPEAWAFLGLTGNAIWFSRELDVTMNGTERASVTSGAIHWTLTVSTVPEPPSWLLLGLGAALLVARRLRSA
jgi:hypothetical protein